MIFHSRVYLQIMFAYYNFTITAL